MAPKSEHKRKSAKYKIDRRLGVNLWGRPKSPVNLRSYAPGQHGQRRKKPTDFGVQLMAKQKFKGYYGNIGEKQFRKYFAEAERRRGDTGQNLIGILECRIDAIVYRLKLAPTVFAARQIINHGHIRVNGKRVNIPSFQVKENDLIEVKDKSKNLLSIESAISSKEREIPDYIQFDDKAKKTKFVRVPKFSEVPFPIIMEPSLVIEYYSR